MSIPKFNISALKQAIERQQSEMKKDIFRSVVMDIWANERKENKKERNLKPLEPGWERRRITISKSYEYDRYWNNVYFLDLDKIEFSGEYVDEPWTWQGNLKYQELKFEQFVHRYKSKLPDWLKTNLELHWEAEYKDQLDLQLKAISSYWDRQNQLLVYILDLKTEPIDSDYINEYGALFEQPFLAYERGDGEYEIKEDEYQHIEKLMAKRYSIIIDPHSVLIPTIIGIKVENEFVESLIAEQD
jgi:hypothetical protein